jgi:hypothetical protein
MRAVARGSGDIPSMSALLPERVVNLLADALVVL